jgi:putative membrane protein
MNDWMCVAYALAGTLLASLLACIPALHVYNAAALILLLVTRFEVLGLAMLPPQGLAFLMLGMVIGYAVANTIPSLFLSAPDESAVWIVLPGQRYVMRGRAHEAAALTGLGSLGGLFALLALAPWASTLLVPIRRMIQPHLHWMLGTIVAYILLSEWPRGEGRGSTVWARLWDGWRSLIAGLATFTLSGLLGLIVAYRSLVPLPVSFQGLMPAFVGLFAVPWALTNLASRTRIPRQHICVSLDVTPGAIVQGLGAGVLGGLFSAFFPMVSGGIGGLIAGQAIAQRDDRVFLISQGACKTVYYVGALLFFFVPALHLTRGGMASMLAPLYAAYTPREYWLAVAATAVCGALAYALLLGLSRAATGLVSRTSARWLAGGTLVILVVLVAGLTGWRGLLIAATATGIGLIPVLFGARRINCMGALLLPALVNMAGLGPLIAGWLGLI